ncbi:MAG: hypothetical protein K8S55_01425 [Phycisphaerae bacterium]|nr:hypothetical protein [Phycisphaerae bacterium]
MNQKHKHILLIWVLLLCVSPILAQDAKTPTPPTNEKKTAPETKTTDKTDTDKADKKDEEEKPLTPAQKVKICETLAPAFVTVEYSIQFDKSEAPYGAGLPGSQHVGGLIKQERPLEITGLLLSETEVFTCDIMMHPRFIKKIAVRVGDQLIPAKPLRYGPKPYTVILKLAKPVKGIKPLVFDAKAKKPYMTISRYRNNAHWILRTRSASGDVLCPAGDNSLRPTTWRCLVVNRDGVPVGVDINGKLPVDGSWKGSPLDWPGIPAEKVDKMIAAMKKTAEGALFRVTLTFRSPQKQGGYGPVEQQSLGILIDKSTILVLSNLKPKITARLEGIMVNLYSGEKIQAKFAHTLKNYGGFTATLEKPLPNPITISGKDIRPFKDLLLPAVEVRLLGVEVVPYYQHLRISSLLLGWRKQIYPSASPRGTVFFFDHNCRLIAFPIARRDNAASRYSSSGATLTASMYLAKVLKDLDNNIDPSNVPLSEEEENRLAWLGVYLQPLTDELARANNVSQLTNNGSFGAMVSFVFPDSPAEKAGIATGDILIRLHAEDKPDPINIQGEKIRFRKGFPWGRLGTLPEQYYDQIPTPWPPAENKLSRMLTDLGFSKKVTVEIFKDGKVIKKPFVVTQSPKHYGMAKKFKFKDVGMTVKNMTYETRNYFRKKKTDPGVIVSKLKPGKKASTAGIRPYEIITHINDKPVMNVDDFKKLVTAAGSGELRLAVRRQNEGRVTKITIDQTDKKKDDKADNDKPAAKKPADTPAKKTVDAPAKKPADTPAKKTVDAPAKKLDDTPAK